MYTYINKIKAPRLGLGLSIAPLLAELEEKMRGIIGPCGDAIVTPPRRFLEFIDEEVNASDRVELEPGVTITEGEARRRATTWIKSWYDFGDGRKTVYEGVGVRIIDDDDDDDDDDDKEWSFAVRLDPPEPPCSAGGDHDWSNDQNLVGGHENSPGCFGNGAGVDVCYACTRCGLGFVRYTQRQARDGYEDGIEYQPGAYPIKSDDDDI